MFKVGDKLLWANFEHSILLGIDPNEIYTVSKVDDSGFYIDVQSISYSYDVCALFIKIETKLERIIYGIKEENE